MELTNKIIEAIEEPLSSRGYDIVNVTLMNGKRLVVGIDIDRVDGNSVTIDDCVTANHLISAILDVEDFIKGSYNLEVSSPGENRPLKKISDFERFCGKDVKMELLCVVNGKSKLRGKLVRVERSANDAVVYLKEECDSDEIEVSVLHSNIKKASVKRF